MLNKVGIKSLALFLALVSLGTCKNDTATSSTSTIATTPVVTSVAEAYADYPQATALKDYLRAYPDQISAELSDRDIEFKVAMTAYNAGQFQAALDTFPNFTHSPKDAAYIHLYKGISQLMVGEEQESFKTFQRIRAAQEEAFAVSEWYVALNYVAFNDVYAARRKLESIIEKKAYGMEDAKAILDVLPVK